MRYKSSLVNSSQQTFYENVNFIMFSINTHAFITSCFIHALKKEAERDIYIFLLFIENY